MPEFQTVGQRIVSRLAVHVGPNVAKMAVGDFSKKTLGVKLEAVQPADVPKLMDAMRPMLTVLLGKEHTETIVKSIADDCMVG